MTPECFARIMTPERNGPNNCSQKATHFLHSTVISPSIYVHSWCRQKGTCGSAVCPTERHKHTTQAAALCCWYRCWMLRRGSQFLRAGSKPKEQLLPWPCLSVPPHLRRRLPPEWLSSDFVPRTSKQFVETIWFPLKSETKITCILR
jgi:hypothetical protein